MSDIEPAGAAGVSGLVSEPDRLERLEAEMLRLPQADCPVVHHFAPGLYIRELRMKAGTWAIGHRQKHEHLNVVMSGAVRMVKDGGETEDVEAPAVFTGGPGRKVGYVLRDLIWLNIFATNERDITRLEDALIDKSGVWLEHRAEQLRLNGIDPGALPAPSTCDPSEQPDGQSILQVLPSPIHGLGVFLSASVGAYNVIGQAYACGARTRVGRHLNHSDAPNAVLVRRPNDDIEIVSLRAINGNAGGQPGEEVTIDYEQGLALTGQPQGVQA